jgi:hypothetical protein
LDTSSQYREENVWNFLSEAIDESVVQDVELLGRFASHLSTLWTSSPNLLEKKEGIFRDENVPLNISAEPKEPSSLSSSFASKKEDSLPGSSSGPAEKQIIYNPMDAPRGKDLLKYFLIAIFNLFREYVHSSW